MRAIVCGILIVVGGAVLAEFLPPPTWACAPAPHRGDWVEITKEAALIVYDAPTQTEHFIRRASFSTSASDFGFLVPTPTVPELGTVKPGIFDSLINHTAARHEWRTEYRTIFGFGGDGESYADVGNVKSAAPNAMPTAAVEVVKQQKVGDYDATILKADDPEALGRWLQEHGYESRPALVDWLKKYTDDKWVLTAFKLSRPQQSGANGHRIEGNAVRLTFKTDKPFYPYREPADLREPPSATDAAASSRPPRQSSGDGSRELKVFLLSGERYEGRLGAKGLWPGRTVWANQIPSFLASAAAEALEVAPTALLTPGSGAAYLTEFVDGSFPRPGTDEVYFDPLPGRPPVERPPVIHVRHETVYWPGRTGGRWIAGLTAIMLAGAIGLGVLIARNRRQSAHTAQ